MMIKQLDRTETKLNKVHSLSHQNHVAINSIHGMLKKDEVTQLKSLLNEIQKKMRNMKSEINDLKKSKYHCHIRMYYLTQ